MADSKKRLCRLFSEYGRECRRRKLLVNVDKGKVMRCSRYVNMGRMDMRLHGKPLEEVDCFKYFGSKVAAGKGYERFIVHRMNEG